MSDNVNFTYTGNTKSFDKAVTNVVKGLDKIAHASEKVSQQTNTSFSKLNTSITETKNQITKLGANSQRASNKIKTAMAGMASSTDKVTSSATRLVDKFNASGSAIANNTKAIDASTKLISTTMDHMVKRMASAFVELDKRIMFFAGHLKTASSETSGDSKSMADSMQQAAGEYMEGVTKMSQGVKEFANTSNNANEKVAKTTSDSMEIMENRATNLSDIRQMEEKRAMDTAIQASLKRRQEYEAEALGLQKVVRETRNLATYRTATNAKGEASSSETRQLGTVTRYTSSMDALRQLRTELSRTTAAMSTADMKADQLSVAIAASGSQSAIAASKKKLIGLAAQNNKNLLAIEEAQMKFNTLTQTANIDASIKSAHQARLTAAAEQYLAGMLKQSRLERQLNAQTARVQAREEAKAAETARKAQEKVRKEHERMRKQLEKESRARSAWGNTSINSLNSVANATRRLERQVSRSFRTMRRVVMAFVSGYGLGSVIDKSMDYIETVNLFAVAMGDAAEEGHEFIDTMTGNLGLDPVHLMNMQGTFNLLAKSIGNTSDQAEIMSRGLTQLAVDWASLRNLDVEDVNQKLQSGIVGLTRSVRTLGLDISMTSLQHEAMLQGIDANVENMNQVNKMQLRYAALMRQSQAAMGDFARTATQPANQMRILKEQVVIAARSFGNMFLPALQKVLPWLIAIARFLGELFQIEAVDRGFNQYVEEAEDNALAAAGGVKILSDEVDSLEGNIKSLGKAMKTVMGFDELNRVTSRTETGGLGGGLGELGDFDISLPEYDMGLSGALEESTKLLENIRGWWKELKKTPTFVALIDTLKWAWEAVKDVVGWLAGAIGDIFSFTTGNLGILGPIGGMVGAFLGVMTTIGIVKTAIGKFATFLGAGGPLGLAIGIIAGIITGVLIVAVQQIKSPVEEVSQVIQDNIDSITDWEEAYSNANPTLVDVNDLVSKSGKTYSEITGEIETVEAAITEVYKTAYEANRTLRDAEIESIRGYLTELRSLNTEQLEMLIQQALATYQLAVIRMQTDKDLTAEDMAALQKSMDTAKQIVEDGRDTLITTELTKVNQLHEESGTLNSEAHRKEAQDLVDHYDAMVDEALGHYSHFANVMAAGVGAQERLSSDSYAELRRLNDEYDKDYETFIEDIDEVNGRHWDNEWDRTDALDRLKREWLGKQETYNDKTKGLYEDMNTDLDNAFLAMVATTISEGGTLDAETKATVAKMLETYEPMKGEMTEATQKAWDALIGTMDKAAPDAGFAAAKTPAQVMSKLRTGFGMDSFGRSTKMEEMGANLIKGLQNGLMKPISGRSGLVWTANNVADTLNGAFKTRLGVMSPSKVFFDIGLMLMKGLQLGVEKNVDLVEKAYDKIPDPDLTTTYGAINSSNYGTLATAPVARDESASVAHDRRMAMELNRLADSMGSAVVVMDGQRVGTMIRNDNRRYDRRYGV